MSFRQVENARSPQDKPRLFDPEAQVFKKPLEDMMKDRIYKDSYLSYKE